MKNLCKNTHQTEKVTVAIYKFIENTSVQKVSSSGIFYGRHMGSKIYMCYYDCCCLHNRTK